MGTGNLELGLAGNSRRAVIFDVKERAEGARVQVQGPGLFKVEARGKDVEGKWTGGEGRRAGLKQMYLSEQIPPQKRPVQQRNGRDVTHPPSTFSGYPIS